MFYYEIIIARGKKFLLDKTSYFKDQLDKFETEDIRAFTELCIKDVPEYFFEIPASSTGKHHNETDCLEHGLVYHTISAFKILNYILEIEKLNPTYKLNNRMRDLMRSAVLLHDSHKQGTQEEYDKAEEHSTAFRHPLYAAKFVLEYKDCGIISRKEIMKISQLIASHMGVWNTDSHNEGETVRLPVPTLPEEKIVHLADYLGSREDIIIKQPGSFTVTINH